MNKILEMSRRMAKGGRKRIKMVLLTIHKDGETNRNGITWKEDYVLNNLESIKGIPLCATFINEDKDLLSDHGYTETVELDGKNPEPIFENSTSVGYIENAKIEDVELDGEVKRVLVGYGWLYCQRYPKLCQKLEAELATSPTKSSIEIMGTDENNNNIIYENNFRGDGRKPMVFDFSGTCLLGVLEADENCYVLEVAQKKEQEETKMDERTMKELIVSTIAETNSKNDDLAKIINELNSTIADKDTQIADLNAKVEANATADADKDAKIEELNGKIAELEAKLDECKKAEQNSALDKALEVFTETEQKYAESEINAFRENPIAGNVDVVVNAINAGIGKAVKAAEADAKVAEQNSAKEDADLDIFSEVNSVEDEDDSDVNIF